MMHLNSIKVTGQPENNPFASAEQPVDNKVSKLVFLITLGVLVLLASLFISSVRGSEHTDDTLPQLMIFITMLTAGIWFCYEIAKRGLTAWSVFLFFMFCFYGIMPLIYFRSGFWLFGDISSDNRKGVLLVSGLSLAFILIASLGRIFFEKVCGKRLNNFYKRHCRRVYCDEFSFLLPVIQVAATLFIALVLGKDVLLLRGATSETISFESFWVVVILNFIRPLSFFPFCLYLIISRGKWDLARLANAALLGILALIGNIPTSTPRFYLFMLFTVLLYAVFFGSKYWRIAGLGFLFFGFFGGVITDQFRHMRNVDQVTEVTLNLDGYVTAGHFDAFEMNIYAIDYAESYGYENGRQVLGVIGFWVPRIFWINKPVPTGALLGTTFIGGLTSTTNTNLSCPLPAEGYIDLGVAGVIVYALLAGLFIGFVDYSVISVWSLNLGIKKYNGALVLSAMVFPVLVGMILFLSRGSLMPAAAYTTGSFFAAVFIYWFFTRKAE